MAEKNGNFGGNVEGAFLMVYIADKRTMFRLGLTIHISDKKVIGGNHGNYEKKADAVSP